MQVHCLTSNAPQGSEEKKGAGLRVLGWNGVCVCVFEKVCFCVEEEEAKTD